MCIYEQHPLSLLFSSVNFIFFSSFKECTPFKYLLIELSNNSSILTPSLADVLI